MFGFKRGFAEGNQTMILAEKQQGENRKVKYMISNTAKRNIMKTYLNIW